MNNDNDHLPAAKLKNWLMRNNESTLQGQSHAHAYSNENKAKYCIEGNFRRNAVSRLKIISNGEECHAHSSHPGRENFYELGNRLIDEYLSVSTAKTKWLL